MYAKIRRQSEQLAANLSAEDCNLQAIYFTSPVKWHLAHTTWFFETFLLNHHPKYQLYHPDFIWLFNSYYLSVNLPHTRSQRGLLSRPTLEEIYNYRKYVDNAMQQLILENPKEPYFSVGLHHEEQHQELILTDILYNFYQNPLYPAYHQKKEIQEKEPLAFQWYEIPEGIYSIGTSTSIQNYHSFAYDNEMPQHKVFLHSYKIANRLVTNAEYLEFIEAGGYENPSFWLSDGWDFIQASQRKMPYYWQKQGKDYFLFTLEGLIPLPEKSPVSHISFYEADAYARFRQTRLPTEAEWEAAVKTLYGDIISSKIAEGNFLETGLLRPVQKKSEDFFGNAWEWTVSHYEPYPNYVPWENGLGEYNGKFMNNQRVLKGGSCFTPKEHIRATYRNFFQPEMTWQAAGIRLAKS
ncbi:MAG: ergothioneine biosynthesis protein EgtB [Candidatus Hydrogenedentota bacterium]|nr:MAG: ergothioneine biosynthesis protein EgtB [Candidatus Hydrogenedentota bacterium]